jgi:hypothetical protein
MKTKIFIVILIIIVLVVSGICLYKKNQKIKLPLFSNYPAEALTVSPLPPINLSSHPIGSTFKTRISAVNNEKPNFAGKYSIVPWGCGSNCMTGVIIDRNTGTILGSLPFIMEHGYEAYPDSSLIIVDPYIPDPADVRYDHSYPTYFYNWTREEFRLINKYNITKDSITQL